MKHKNNHHHIENYDQKCYPDEPEGAVLHLCNWVDSLDLPSIDFLWDMVYETPVDTATYLAARIYTVAESVREKPGISERVH
ncbi:hypothetical protein AVEN_149939-1 [Araneus ventricosus]|uniref:Uncharacterized protein n=1 Tax=Araneus ventricosus TaxID=182803 RepID=A0A4Y2M1A7_ARAVE|nr:hypothetical protein AVEN_149939-1 [Araneus ventricosus]